AIYRPSHNDGHFGGQMRKVASFMLAVLLLAALPLAAQTRQTQRQPQGAVVRQTSVRPSYVARPQVNQVGVLLNQTRQLANPYAYGGYYSYYPMSRNQVLGGLAVIGGLAA